MCMYSRFTLLYSRNQYSVVKQLCKVKKVKSNRTAIKINGKKKARTILKV